MNEILPGLLIKSALLSAVALLTAGLLRKFAARRVSAAARHLVCLSAFVALLLLPVLSLALPAWRVVPAGLPRSAAPAPPAAEATASAEEATTSAGETAPEVGVAAGGSAANDIPAITPSRQTIAPSAPVFRTEGAQAWAARVGSGGYFVPGLYAALSLVLLSRLAFGHLGVWRMVRRAKPLPGLTGAGAPVRESAEVAVPLTAGIGRGAVIVLPAGFAASVPAERLDAVLAHEAAHVRRGDYSSQAFADVVCALHFVNPLIWLLSGALRGEAERAADDRVVTAGGVRPSDYAAHLLDTVRGLRKHPGVTPFAVTIARRPDISSRIGAVLAPDANRTGRISKPAMIGLGLTCAVVAGGVATLRAAGDSEPAARQTVIPAGAAPVAQANQFRRTLPDGTEVSVVCVSSAQGDKSGRPVSWKPYWQPNGEPFGFRSFQRDGFPKSLNSYRYVVSLNRKRSSDKHPEHSVRVQGVPSVLMILGPDQSLHFVDVPMGGQKKSGTLDVKVSRLDWHPLLAVTALVDGKGGYLNGASGTGTFRSGTENYATKFQTQRPVKTAKGSDITTTHEILHNGKAAEAECRFVAETWQGKRVIGLQRKVTRGGSAITSTASFPGLPLARVKSFRMEARILDQVYFSGVATKPKTAQESSLRNTPFRQMLADGTGVEILSVMKGTSLNTKNRVFWKPDGQPIIGSRTYSLPYGQGTGISVSNPNEPQYELAVALHGPRADWPKFNRIARGSGAGGHDIHTGMTSSSGGMLPSHVSLVTLSLISPSESGTTVRVGVAKKEWHTLQTVGDFQSIGSTSTQTNRISAATTDTEIPSVAFALLRPHDTPEGTVVTVSHGSFGQTDVDYRFVAEMWDGKTIVGKSLGSVNSAVNTVNEVLLPGTPRARVKEFRMQARTYDWATFPGIALRPNRQVAPEEKTRTASVARTADDEKETFITLRYDVPSDSNSHNIRIDVTDSRGTRTLLTESHNPGDKVPLDVTFYGNKVTFRVYDNDVLQQKITGPPWSGSGRKTL